MQGSFLSASPPVVGTGRVTGSKYVPRGTIGPSSGGNSVEESSSRASLDVSTSSNSIPFSAHLSSAPASVPTCKIVSSPISNSFQSFGFEPHGPRAEGSNVAQVVRQEKMEHGSKRGLLSLTLGGNDQEMMVVNQGFDTTRSLFSVGETIPVTERPPWDLDTLQMGNKIFSHPDVVNAYLVATKAHEGQMRKNGEPVIAHCAETARVLADLNADPVTVAGALLHDVLDDSSFTIENLRAEVPLEIVELVKKVSSISYLSQLVRDHRMAGSQDQRNKLRDMLIGASDCRAVLIKLADRLHNLRTISSLPFAKQVRIAEETMEIFVPLAGRLGCWTIKSELEDLCFRIELPQEYKNLKAQYDEFINERESSHLGAALKELKAVLDADGIKYEDIVGRPKNLYGVYKKMLKRRSKSLTDVHDLLALRIVVHDKISCYAVLRKVHQVWHSVEGRFRDYIRNPKKNGYQSIHDVVMTDDGVPFEVQIRTAKMHYIAENGVAAHWRYKEDEDGIVNELVEARTVWSRYILSCLLDINDKKSRPEGFSGSPSNTSDWARMFCSFNEREHQYKPCQHHASHPPRPVSENDFGNAPVYAVFRTMDNLSVCTVTQNCTVREFLELNGSSVTNSQCFPLVNGNPAFMDQTVHFGDVVELENSNLTSDSAKMDIFSLGSVVPVVMNTVPGNGKAGMMTTPPPMSSDDLLKALV